MAQPPNATEYEKLIEHLVRRLAERAPVQTERIKWDEDIQGRSTSNQIDVVWDFVDKDGQRHRVVFEARAYKSDINQGKLHQFRSVVDDIQDPTRPVTGVMVTTARYQSGARDVASTYGVIVLELHQPVDDELTGRLQRIVIEATPILTSIVSVEFDVVEVLAEQEVADGIAHRDAFAVVLADGQTLALAQLLDDGDAEGSNDVKPVQAVSRKFDPPAVLLSAGREVARIRGLTASVGDFIAPPVTATVAGPENVAWLLCNSLTGSRAWIADDDRMWVVDP